METRKKTNENYYQDPRYKDKPMFFVAEDGSYVYHCDRLVDEYTLPADFRFIQKTYYRNGSLERKCLSDFDGGMTEELFDEDGYLTSERHLVSKWKEVRMDHCDLLTFLEKEGWFDRSTGQTIFRDKPFSLNTGELTYEVYRKIQIGISEDDASKAYIFLNMLPDVPPQFLEKYGKTRSDGTRYLEGENNSESGYWTNVSYMINLDTGIYEVEWNFEAYII